MQDFNLDSLNEQQKQALLQIDGAVLVTAGAGSGKTKLLTHRIAYLVEHLGVPQSQILAITFTNKAANEMKERVQNMLKQDCLVWISTFHSMCSKILRRHIDFLGYKNNFSIYSESDCDKLIDTLLTDDTLFDDKKDLKKALKYHISNRKNNNYSYEQYRLLNQAENGFDVIFDLMIKYDEKLFQNNALDFDDLLTKTYELFVKFPDVKNLYANQFKYILVDEYQDTNVIQYEIVKLLVSVHKNIFVVGDEDQTIYSWRGANYQNIRNFIQEFNAKVFKLETNYRSTPDILELANKVIKNNSSRLPKVLQAIKSSGVKPEFYEAFDEQAEANYIVDKIQFLVEKQGYLYKDFAILVRLNALTFPFEQTLLSYNIPYKVFGGFKFFERAEIKTVISYLRLFINSNDEVALLRIINFPKRGIGDGAISKLREIANKERKTLFEVMLECDSRNDIPTATKNNILKFVNTYLGLLKDYEQLTIFDFAKAVVDRFEIKSAYEAKIEEEFERILNIEQFFNNIKDFQEKNVGASLGDYLESVTLISDIDTLDESNNVVLATIHSVKGLEFKVVFVVGLEEKTFPIKRAFDKLEDLEEERRLMYVAITRAEERLYLTHCTTRFLYGKREYFLPSRFLKECGYNPILKPKTVEYEKREFEFAPQFDFKKTVFSNSSVLQSEKSQKDISKFKVGQIVLHPRYDRGEIIAINGDDADVKFEGFGVKTLILSLAPLEIIEE